MQSAYPGMLDTGHQNPEKNITPEILRDNVLHQAISLYYENPKEFQLNLSEYRNLFDETCQGTVPVALWIIMHSHNFEDAIRQLLV